MLAGRQWKAATGSAAIDAGAGNEFHNARASCIAGPCPFTRIDDSLSNDSQTFRVTALDWSDTATFCWRRKSLSGLSATFCLNPTR